MTAIAFKEGYRYQLAHDYSQRTGIIPAKKINTPYVDLDTAGTLTVSKGYAWDGASGAIDTRTILRGSLVHDALYALIREGHLEQGFKVDADNLLQMICIEDGMSAVRAWWVHRAVSRFATFAVRPSSRKPVLYAP